MLVIRYPKVRRAALAGSLAACLTMGVAFAPAAEAGPLRTKLLGIINRIRVNHDLDRITINRPLSDDAKAHTRKMIRRGELFDPKNLYDLLEPYDWSDVGADVVGCHATLNAMVKQWMGEAFHRTIILHPDLRRAGVAVIRVDGRSPCGRNQLWATAIMYG
jgi:uncharacterized protein YkwD